jgi:hypothetical protein
MIVNATHLIKPFILYFFDNKLFTGYLTTAMNFEISHYCSNSYEFLRQIRQKTAVIRINILN